METTSSARDTYNHRSKQVKKKEFEGLDCTHPMLFRGTGLHY